MIFLLQKELFRYSSDDLYFNQQAAALGTKILDEDGLLDLIRTMPGKKSKYEIAAEAEVCKTSWFIEGDV